MPSWFFVGELRNLRRAINCRQHEFARLLDVVWCEKAAEVKSVLAEWHCQVDENPVERPLRYWDCVRPETRHNGFTIRMFTRNLTVPHNLFMYQRPRF